MIKEALTNGTFVESEFAQVVVYTVGIPALLWICLTSFCSFCAFMYEEGKTAGKKFRDDLKREIVAEVSKQ